MDSDFLLIKKMKMGNEQAIDFFVQKHYPQILKYCRLHIKDPGYAEDMTQETFERFFGTLHQYQHYGKVANFLYVIAANCCKDYYKKKSDLVMGELPEQTGQSESMKNIDEWIDIHMALKNLPNELREVAILWFFQGLKQREISIILGIGLPLVKYRVRKAKDLLVHSLEMEECL